MSRCSSRRAGITLVELLVVVSIMLLITGVAIRVTAPALAGRRQREAARMVNVYLSGARTRAMQTGMPVGVIFENGPVDPSACVSLSYCQTPPPYSGDFLGSTISLLGNGAFGAWLAKGPPWPLTNIDPTKPAFPMHDTGWIQTVAPGDLLVINGIAYQLWAGEPFIDVLPAGSPDGVYNPGEPFTDVDWNGSYTPPNLSNVDPVSGFFVSFPPPGSGLVTYQYFDVAYASNMSSPTGVDESGAQFVLSQRSVNGLSGNANTFKFEIIRRPVRQAGVATQIPDGSCIDLGNSGMDTGITPYNGIGPSLASFAPLGRFPLMLTFSPRGEVDRLWFNGQPRLQPTASVYFAVGKRELVPVGLEAVDGKPSYTYQDHESLWVGVSMRGRVGAAAASPAFGPTPLAQLYTSRRDARNAMVEGSR